MEEAEEKGKIEGKIEIAKKMKAEGMQINLIMKITSLSREEIEGI